MSFNVRVIWHMVSIIWTLGHGFNRLDTELEKQALSSLTKGLTACSALIALIINFYFFGGIIHVTFQQVS